MQLPVHRTQPVVRQIVCGVRREGLSTDDAFRRITQARRALVPDTPEQLRWVEALRFDP